MNHTSPKHIGDYNKNQMLSILRERGPTSRVELSGLLGISQTAVTRNISKLLKKGIIRECGSKLSTMGRKPVLMELCGDFCYVLGADIVGGTIKVALADLLGNIVKEHEEHIQRKKGARAVLEQLIAALQKTIADADVPMEKIWTLTIGTSGVFDPEAGKSRLAYFLEGWEDIDIRKEVLDSISIETLIENDVNLDLIGESWKGVGKYYDNILYVKLGQGLAARFIVEGKLVRGEHNMAGEIGHMLPSLKQEKSMNFEDLLSNSAIARQYRELTGSNKVGNLTGLRELAFNGDEAAMEIMRNLLDLFTLILLNSATVLDPQVIILGGELCCFKESEITLLRKRIERHFPILHNIMLSRLDKKASLYGAIKMGLLRAEERITEIW